ncbi:MAG: putative motility protein [Candidatus Saccharibacteria bacterium]
MASVGSISPALADQVAIATMKMSMEQQAAPVQTLLKSMEQLSPVQEQRQAPPAAKGSPVGNLIDLYA